LGLVEGPIGYLEERRNECTIAHSVVRDGKFSEISFGAWAIGGSWGQVSDEDSMAALHKVIDCGVNFIDTADVYGGGRSERLIARLKKERKHNEEIIVATKAGRHLPRQTVEGYSRENLSAWIDDSLRNLSTERLDLVQLHGPHCALFASGGFRGARRSLRGKFATTALA
jgi:aryl-alcohol dehydrogenase-like predicted oxidoreductase